MAGDREIIVNIAVAKFAKSTGDCQFTSHRRKEEKHFSLVAKKESGDAIGIS